MRLVLLPGLDGTGILFEPLVAALPPTITPMIVSYPPDRLLSYQELFPLVMAALPVSGPFILLAESFSGPLAVMAAATRPANLIGVILCATFVTRPIPWIAWAVPILARSLFFRLRPPIKRLTKTMLGLSTPQLRELYEQTHATVHPSTIAFRIRMLFHVDVSEELRACCVPMLYIAANRDIVVPARNLRLIQQIKPDIQIITIPSPHAVVQARSAQVSEAITNFIISLARQSASDPSV